MLLSLDVIPIINENDVTSVDELGVVNEGYKSNFSDNDILSVLVAGVIEANLVIILSDVDGLYTIDPSLPGAKLIHTVNNITTKLKSMSGKNKLGRGGIRSKVRAAEIATNCGIPVVLANARKDNIILDILEGKKVGTYFKALPRMPAIKRWIAYGAAVKGQIHINEKAKKAILNGASLLPIGVLKVVGQFNNGDVVSLIDLNGVEFAKANPNFTSEELNLIKGLQLKEVNKILSLKNSKDVVEHHSIHLLESEEDECN